MSNFFKKIFRVGSRLVVFLGIIVIVVFGISRLITVIYSAGRIFSAEESPTSAVAIVFGAGLLRDGTPTPVLRDRVATAVSLYKTGKIKKILMSGDNRFIDYNEPGSMRTYAISLGVPAEDIVLDFAGRRTYDTCFRAKEIFQLDEVILVTQNFHLPRALFTCNFIGLNSWGVSADLRQYRRSSYLSWQVRESLATLVAFWDVLVAKPPPVLGSPEPIFYTEKSPHSSK